MAGTRNPIGTGTGIGKNWVEKGSGIGNSPEFSGIPLGIPNQACWQSMMPGLSEEYHCVSRFSEQMHDNFFLYCSFVGLIFGAPLPDALKLDTTMVEPFAGSRGTDFAF